MNVSSRLNPPLMAGRDFPEIQGKVRLVLHNCKNHTDDFVYESHNTATNLLADIFAANHGGLVNYDNFADLYKTWLGGVLVFKNALDPTAVSDYGIPDRITNPITAHAGQTPLTSQADDTTRGNPDDAGTVITANTTKLVWEWGTSAGNGQISAVGLTHTDVGSYGAGVVSTAQASLNPFADIGCISRTYSYGDNASTVLAIYNNVAYNIYLVDSTTVHIYKTPINCSKFNLQGGSLSPLTDYKTTVTATLPNAYGRRSGGSFYYDFDFANNKAILYGVPTQGGTTLYKDEINLDTGAVTHTSITVTGAKLWQFITLQSLSGSELALACPTRAMVINNHLYVFGYTTQSIRPDKIYSINLSNTADIDEVDTSDFATFNDSNVTSLTKRHAICGGIIVHDGFLINGDKTFGVASSTVRYDQSAPFVMPNSMSSPIFGVGTSTNMVSVSKLYLATKFSLDAPVTKNSSQSMTIEYTLTQS